MTAIQNTEHVQTTPASPAAPHVMPRAGSRDGTAPLKSNPQETLHRVLFIAGAILLPAGLIVIGLGWYGVSHTPYIYDQNAYIVSGGILGLGITFAGGFLYFSSWLARIAADQKDAQRKLSETLLVLADAVSHNTRMAAAIPAAAEAAAGGGTARVTAPVRPQDPGSVLVVAGNGKTVHRADCDLVSGREDLRPAGPDTADLVPCRLCRR